MITACSKNRLNKTENCFNLLLSVYFHGLSI